MTRFPLPEFPLPEFPLPWFDRKLLSSVARLVPADGRREWSLAWQAELWHVHHRGRRDRLQTLTLMTDLAIGLTRDACWLRGERWRVALRGTPGLCLGSLAAFSLLCALIALDFSGDWQTLCFYLRAPFERCVITAPLVLFVAFAIAPRRHTEQNAMSRNVIRVKPMLFFAVKVTEMFCLAFLLSVTLCYPLRSLLPNTADLLQMFDFVLLAVTGMRWAFDDQEQRCKHCLQSLAAPARVGRPSHNLLEWNGTELSCKQGHGRLSVPEMETSWCQSSHWIDLATGWDKTMSL